MIKRRRHAVGLPVKHVAGGGFPPDYSTWLADLKRRIAGARQKSLFAANAHQIRLYHEIGRDILVRQNRQGWGAKVIDRLSADLREAFPEMKGLSATNLKYMRFFCPGVPRLSNWSAVR